MRVVIYNEMPFRIHVAAVQTDRTSIRFVFSKKAIEIPNGKTVGHHDVEIGDAVETGELPEDMQLSCVQHELADNLDIIYQEGTDQDDREVRCFRVRPQKRDLN